MIHASPIVRARAVGLEDQEPEWVAIPAMIARLGDPDRVVRLTANEELKKRTHRDFGYVAWGSGRRAESGHRPMAGLVGGSAGSSRLSKGRKFD